MEDFAELLKIYYRRFFPFDIFCEWLDYKHEKNAIKSFPHREFSFTLENDAYLRYNNFHTKEEFTKKVIELSPYKIDIGGEYNEDLKHRTSMAKVIRRELVFDIDMTDYDDVRKCCRKETICPKCWPFMTIACEVIDRALREDFGYEHILWVFSGRRGIHCWVCDKEARNIDNNVRASIVSYLNHVYGIDSQQFRKKAGQVFRKTPLHPSIRRAISIIDKHFEKLCLDNQDILKTEEDVTKFLRYIPDESVRAILKKDFQTLETSRDRWECFVYNIEILRQKNQLKYSMRNILDEIKAYYAYPRLDINVSKSMNHLLKAPFCVHPKTGKVCVPFHRRNVENFDPDAVPTIMTLIEELKVYEANIDPSVPEFNRETVKDSRKTGLLKYLRVFEEYVSRLKRQAGVRKIEPDDF